VASRGSTRFGAPNAIAPPAVCLATLVQETSMSASKLLILVLVVAVALVGLAGIAVAQDAGDAAAPQTRTIGDNIMAAGIIGWLIIMLSIASIGFIIEHFVNIRRDKLIPPEIVQELEVLFDEEQYEEALNFCETQPGFITNVIAASLPRMTQGYDAMRDSAQQIGEEEATKLQLKITPLSLFAAIGPMMGLFGTVTGMVVAFDTIATKVGGANPQDLASGISQALMTTVMGLIVALISLPFYFFFKNKVTKLTLEAGVICSELIDRFRPVDA
jgi:biopolymer transport protein ExbB